MKKQDVKIDLGFGKGKLSIKRLLTEIEMRNAKIEALSKRLKEQEQEFIAAKEALFNMKRAVTMPIYSKCNLYLCGDNTMTLVANLTPEHVLILCEMPKENDLETCDLKDVSPKVTTQPPLLPY